MDMISDRGGVKFTLTNRHPKYPFKVCVAYICRALETLLALVHFTVERVYKISLH